MGMNWIAVGAVAAILSAIGTITTAGVAIWIANADKRERKNRCEQLLSRFAEICEDLQKFAVERTSRNKRAEGMSYEDYFTDYKVPAELEAGIVKLSGLGFTNAQLTRIIHERPVT